jgi:hypothetical protein
VYAYECPGESLLDVSWHVTANPAPGSLNTFIMEPNLAAVVTVSGNALKVGHAHSVKRL